MKITQKDTKLIRVSNKTYETLKRWSETEFIIMGKKLDDLVEKEDKRKKKLVI